MHMDSEIRQNKATRQWVIFAPSRLKRPHTAMERRDRTRELPGYDSGCPFCAGNEDQLPEIIMETAGIESGGAWQTRVVPNKFPALSQDNRSTERIRQDIYISMQGFGRHEVIIESPHHNEDLSQMSVEQVGTIIETYHRRYVDLMAEHENMMTIIFRNHGPRAGTSLIHPHSQLIVTGMVPHHIRRREEEAQRYFDEWGRCVYCDILEYEAEYRHRVILENDSFLAFVPFAADVPFEVWIMPRMHKADFGYISDTEKGDLSSALRRVLSKLYAKLHDPDYNYVINTSARYKADEPQLHWFLQVRPRLTTPAGFEIGSGISINPSLPEYDASYLNEE